ncbi:MAG: SUMF1/EgtB/PvdO family nonheme iron enzyme [bacterium]
MLTTFIIMPWLVQSALGQPQSSQFRIPATVIIPATECSIPQWVRDRLPGCPPVIHLATYAIGQYEVTNEQYLDFVVEAGYRRQNLWSPDGWYYKTKRKWRAPINWPPGHTYRRKQRLMPVVAVSWYEAEAYCRWLTSIDPQRTYRLPTEMEWLYAAIGPRFTQWPWGDDWDPTRCNFCDQKGNSYFPTGEIDGFMPLAPVGSYERGKSFFGCYDMVGNAEEWCLEWYNRRGLSDDELARKIVRDPFGLYKICHGGSWIIVRPDNLLPIRRAGTFPFVRRIFYGTTGFRICYSISECEMN